ncbi:MAG: S8 family serine peptidase, partial [candidate division WOR-3 bacterium]
KIESIDDLPRHTYKVTGTLTELITHEIAFKPFAAQVRADIEQDLETYEILDKTTLKTFYRILVRLDMLAGNYDAALAGTARLRELEDKPASKLTNGLIDESIIHAHREIGGAEESMYRDAFSRHLSQAIAQLPWDVVQERIGEIKGGMEMNSKNFLLGVIQSQFEPAVEKSGMISNEVAEQVITIRYIIEVRLPLKEQIVEVLETYIMANRVEKPDIWRDRHVDLSDAQNLTPVVVAIWDSGVDTDIYPDQLYVNTKEKPNGTDDDGNGYIDDIHGIAYNMDDEKTSELLYPLKDARERLPEMKKMIKGLFDVMAAIESPEATALKQKIATMNPEDVKPFMEDIMRIALYAHGTHTAGITVEGNPAARILVARLTIDYRTIPPPPTVEKARKSAMMYREVIHYFKSHGVRVVNMSWGGTLRGTESDLEANGIGNNAAERAQLAREIFDIEKNALYDAIENAPDILFVNAAGNDNDDVAFEDYYPASFDLPNVLTVGAVDQSGDETSFTSFGERVHVYANGYEVESYLPGGDRLAASGTSASSPNAANLAAKLFALDPSLKATDVMTIITKGADRSEDGRLLLINPKRSVELLENFRKNKK